MCGTLIVAPIQKLTEQAIEQRRQLLFGEASFPEPARELSDKTVEDSPSNRLGMARLSQERLLGWLFSLVPLLLHDSSQSGNDLRGFVVRDVCTTLRTLFPPYTSVRITGRVGTSEDLWVVAVAAVETSDNAYLQEEALAEKCFAFNRRTKQFQTFDLRDLHVDERTSVAQTSVGILHLHRSYDFGDVANILAWADAVCARVAQPNAQSDLNTTLRGEGLDFLGTAYHEIDATEDQGLRSFRFASRTTDGPIAIDIGTAFDPSTWVRLLLPPIRIRSSLAVRPVVGRYWVPRISTSWELFPDGLIAELYRMPDMGSIASRVSAPGRLEGSCQIGNARVEAFEPSWSIGKLATKAVADAFGTMAEVRARNLIRDYLNLVGAAASFGDHADLWMRILTLRNDSSLSESCLFDLNDVGIGLLYRMGRPVDAHQLVLQQRKKLEQVQDRSLAAMYLVFYDKLVAANQRGAALGLTLSFSASGPFSCYQEWVHWQHSDRPQKRIPARPLPITTGEPQKPISVDNSVDVRNVISRCVDESRLTNPRRQIVHTVAQAIWEYDGRLQTVSRALMEPIERKWRDSLRQMATLDEYDFLSRACFLRWQTYHGLKSGWEPLSAEQQVRRDYQRNMLIACIEQLARGLDCDAQVPDVLATFRDTVRQAVQVEVSQTVDRLDEVVSSPMNPLAYYPLSEDRFASALEKVKHRTQRELLEFLEEASNKERELLAAALRKAASGEGRIDFFQNECRDWLFGQARIMVSLVAGEMFSQYCLGQRKIAFSDRRLFPFEAPEGVQLVYRLQGGLTMDLTLPYEEVRETNKGESGDGTP
jgi:hypothetical protein